MIVFMLSSHQPWPWLLLPPHAPCSCALSILDTEYLIHIFNSQQHVITGTAFNCHRYLLTLLFSNLMILSFLRFFLALVITMNKFVIFLGELLVFNIISYNCFLWIITYIASRCINFVSEMFNRGPNSNRCTYTIDTCFAYPPGDQL